MTTQTGDSVEFYCVKCRTKRAVPYVAVVSDRTAKGRPMLRAACPTCGTKMVSFRRVYEI